MAGSANSRPIDVTRVAHRTPTDTTETGSGRLKGAIPRTPSRQKCQSARLALVASRKTSYTRPEPPVNNPDAWFEIFFTKSV